jgi:hypothetical protein
MTKTRFKGSSQRVSREVISSGGGAASWREGGREGGKEGGRGV